MRLVEEQRELAVQGLKKLEEGGKPVTATTLRSLRSLQTPDARAAVIPVLTARKRPQLQQVEAAITAASREMWIKFHWSTDNELLNADLGVSPCSFHSVGGMPSLLGGESELNPGE